MSLIDEEIKDYLLGSSKSTYDAVETFSDQVSEEEVMKVIELSEIQCCACCGWWVEESEVTEQDHEYYCEDCIENF